MLFTDSSKTKGFISHRCGDYHKEAWNLTFENFLRKHNINPKYGCPSINPKLPAHFEGATKEAMSECYLYIAIITKSWIKRDGDYWPVKDWKIWESRPNTDEKIKTNTLGFSLIDRSNQILKGIITRKTLVFRIDFRPLSNKTDYCFYADEKTGMGIYCYKEEEIQEIDNRLKMMVKRANEHMPPIELLFPDD